MTYVPSDDVAHVRAYYEHNTRLFLALGRKRPRPHIHRAIWARGTRTQAQALAYINNLVQTTIAQDAAHNARASVRVLDLGCGVGGTLGYLAQHLALPIQSLGVSISPTQVRLATAYAAASQLHTRCAFVEADYMHLPCPMVFDYVVAIEALVHAPDMGRVLAEAAAALKPGGLLLICDDFLTDTLQPNQHHPATRAWVAAFQRGWRAAGLVSRSTAIALAQQAGLQLVDARDLTPDLRLLPFPMWLGRIVLHLGRRLPGHWAFVQSLVGGLALQGCLRYQIIGYHWLVFQKHEPLGANNHSNR